MRIAEGDRHSGCEWAGTHNSYVTRRIPYTLHNGIETCDRRIDGYTYTDSRGADGRTDSRMQI